MTLELSKIIYDMIIKQNRGYQVLTVDGIIYRNNDAWKKYIKTCAIEQIQRLIANADTLIKGKK